MQRLLHTALLTEDPLQAKALKTMLKQYLILTHITSFLELERAPDGQFDALFCDWCFGNSGLKYALKNVQTRQPTLPVIILSKTGGEREWIEALDAGAFDLLVPPFSGPSLLAVVEHAAASRMGCAMAKRDLDQQREKRKSERASTNGLREISHLDR